jgi:hypothetical protein
MTLYVLERKELVISYFTNITVTSNVEDFAVKFGESLIELIEIYFGII